MQLEQISRCLNSASEEVFGIKLQFFKHREYKHAQLVDKKNIDAKSHEVTALEHNLKRVTASTAKQTKDITIAVDAAASLRNQIKVLETKVEKQRKSIAQVEEERDRYLVEATDQARRVKRLRLMVYYIL